MQLYTQHAQCILDYPRGENVQRKNVESGVASESRGILRPLRELGTCGSPPVYKLCVHVQQYCWSGIQ